MATEDLIDLLNKYSWSSKHEFTLDEFLNKYRPSMVQNDGTKPWIWVNGSKGRDFDAEAQNAACEEGAQYLNEVTERVEEIKNDPSIPVRSNKKTGAKSKKELREQVQATATEKLKEISLKHKYVCGKWLVFAAADKVDVIWRGIATSLVSGPLAQTSAFQAKVATSPQEENPNYQHVICVYMPDVYDKDAVTKVMRVLLRNHGLNLSGVKSDMYTSLGIDSKHPSGIPSTIWKNTSLMKDAEIKELKEAFFTELSTAKLKATEDKEQKGTSADEEKTHTESSSTKKATAKLGPKLKKKVADDPFTSDNDDEQENTKVGEKPNVVADKKTAAKPAFKLKKKKVVDDDFASDDDMDEEEAPKTNAKGKKSTVVKRRKSFSEDDEDLDERRKKPRGKK
ncbi:hypothetical protein BDN71DRAFT_1439015 [Pleurotus eryngii]|uniref:Uncharacterized protein n=1 Tax=Pleurotus eryngii TaxID=5323 RepID=A0A9P6ABT9_PLEER|nr:hypothetical protein BDN71DRAFT_1439015 [Pleurotus eryngii]